MRRRHPLRLQPRSWLVQDAASCHGLYNCQAHIGITGWYAPFVGIGEEYDVLCSCFGDLASSSESAIIFRLF